MEDRAILKEAKKIFKDILDIVYDIDEEELNQTAVDAENKAKKAKTTQELQNLISDLMFVIDELPNQRDFIDQINEIESLKIDIDELFF
jgi:hypothetical protein